MTWSKDDPDAPTDSDSERQTGGKEIPSDTVE